MGKICIESMEFYAYHGCFSEEQVIGNKYLVDITIDTDFANAAQNDDIEGTINYVDVYELIKTEMATKSKLIEHVGQRIISSVKNKFPDINNIELKLSKLRPPVGGTVEKISVIING